MTHLIFLALMAIALEGAVLVFFTYLPDRKTKKWLGTAAELRRECERPLSDVIAEAERRAELEWARDWRELDWSQR